MDQRILYNFFEGKATSEEEMLVKAWVESSPENKRLFFEQRRLFDSLTLHMDEKDLQELLALKKKTRHRSVALSY
ncbi:MAG: hypothetical protein LUH22_13180 [Bacteroides sp.]|nr:hypothetical protein [Bacteroides sp.]